MSIVIGTAGHVDHGKTCLIKALTGIDTDRLDEEKKRGITIEPGFADLQLAHGETAGIIDVPGHERFIKNMLCGIGGIDLVLLVIAADEGVMPQTREHLDILQLLGIQNGMIVLTKTDMVDQEWLEMVEHDVRSGVKGTFLETAPLIQVSSHTGYHIPELKAMISDMTQNLPERNKSKALFRLPIDRVFTIGGFGTVVTGTLIEGRIAVGDEVMLFPSGKEAKVRNLQVHGKMVDEAFAGQRTAINMTGIKREEMKRGDVLSRPNAMIPSMMLDVKLKALVSAREMKNGSRLHLYYGSAEILCKIILLDRETLQPGEECYAQLRLEEQVAVRKGDRFIVRFYSPVETVGGGTVLEATPVKHRRGNEKALSALRLKEQGEPAQIMEQVIREAGFGLRDTVQLALKLRAEAHETEKLLDILEQQKKVIKLSADLMVHMEIVQGAEKKITEILADYHEKNPILPGMPLEELRSRFLRMQKLDDTRAAEILIRYLAKQQKLRLDGAAAALASFAVSFTPEQQRQKERIEKQYQDSGYEALEMETVCAGQKDVKAMRQMIQILVKSGILVRLDAQNCIHRQYWDQAVAIVRAKIADKGSITLSELRDMLGTSRKYAMMLLDAMDEKKITKKTGDVRILSG